MHRCFSITAGHLLVLTIIVNCDMLLADPSNSRRVGRRLFSPFQVRFLYQNQINYLYRKFIDSIEIYDIPENICLNYFRQMDPLKERYLIDMDV